MLPSTTLKICSSPSALFHLCRICLPTRDSYFTAVCLSRSCRADSASNLSWFMISLSTVSCLRFCVKWKIHLCLDASHFLKSSWALIAFTFCWLGFQLRYIELFWYHVMFATAYIAKCLVLVFPFPSSFFELLAMYVALLGEFDFVPQAFGFFVPGRVVWTLGLHFGLSEIVLWFQFVLLNLAMQQLYCL